MLRVRGISSAVLFPVSWVLPAPCLLGFGLVLPIVIVGRELHPLPALFPGILADKLSAISLVLHGGERVESRFTAGTNFVHDFSVIKSRNCMNSHCALDKKKIKGRFTRGGIIAGYSIIDSSFIIIRYVGDTSCRILYSIVSGLKSCSLGHTIPPYAAFTRRK